jgi:hypothetical protein
VERGATHAELCELLDRYAKAIGETAYILDLKAVADALGGFADTLGNLHSEPGDDTDVLTVAEHAKEIGLCPDSLDHLYGPACRAHECPTYATAEYEDRVAETGRLR